MSQSVNCVTKAIKTNPIIFMGLVCLMLCGVFTQSDVVVVSPMLLIGIGAVLFVYVIDKRSGCSMPHTVLLTVVSVGALIALGYLLISSDHVAVTLLFMGSVFLAVLAVYWCLTKQMTWERCIVLLLAFGFLLRLSYVLYTHVWVRQHDVWNFYYGDFGGLTDQRHAQYIEYIATHLELPSVDPTQVALSQLYHPPFHHIVAGLWLRLNLELGIPHYMAYENIQLLTLFYSVACMIIVYRILRLLGCQKWGLLIPMAIVVFHPTFIIMAGSINNDLLSITLALYGVYGAIRWYQKPTAYHIVTVALAIGFSMMTKLSGGLVAVGIGLVFLWKWFFVIYHKHSLAKTIFFQFLLFGVVCFPLALWWPIRNAVLYEMPFTYVPALNEFSGQYLGEYTASQRWFEVRGESLERIFMAWNNQEYASSYNEYNMFLSLFKTSVFGEFTLFLTESTDQQEIHQFGTVCSHILFWSNIGLIVTSLYAGVRCWFKRWAHPLTWCFTLIWLVVVLSYVQFCFSFPQACTQNFRYAVPTLLCGLVAIGYCGMITTKWFRVVVCIGTGVFCLSSMLVYGLLGMVTM